MSRSHHTPTDPKQTQPNILSPITKTLADNNLTLTRLAKKIDQLVDCTRPAGTGKDGQVIDIPDNPSQLKAVDMALKLQQAYPAERHEVVTDTLEDRLRRIREAVNPHG